MKIVVIGGGVGGMFCAGLLADYGNEVYLIEKNEKLGKKMFISGKGRCNISNLCERQVFMDNIVTNSKFLMSALSKFDPQALMKWCEERGLELKVERGERVFPVSDKSSDVIKCFERFIKESGVKVLLNTRVEKINCDNFFAKGVVPSKINSNVTAAESVIFQGKKLNSNDTAIDAKEKSKVSAGKKIISVALSDGQIIKCDCVVVATGGISYPTTGSTGDGYKFAKELGHTIVQPKPALAPLLTKNVDNLAGLALKNVMVSIVSENGKHICSEFGEMLFTHMGMSGPTVLTLSSSLNKYYNLGKLNGKFFVQIDLKPALSYEKMQDKLLREFAEKSNIIVKNYLPELMPRSLIDKVLAQAKIDEKTPLNRVTKTERDNLIGAIKSLEFEIENIDKIAFAIITSGGVSVKELSPADMQSKLVSGLYFVGEVVDVDALTGGFNIQIALSMAHAMASSLKNN